VATKHGLSRTPEYRVWTSLRHRCLNPSAQSFSRYGGRGIRIAPEWVDSVEAFVRDVGKRPSPRHTLDREDNDGDYVPGNVRWVLPKAQNDNRSVSRRLTAHGRTQSLGDWSRETGIRYTTLIARLDRYGWSPEKAVGEPAVYGRPERKRNMKGQYV